MKPKNHCANDKQVELVGQTTFFSIGGNQQHVSPQRGAQLVATWMIHAGAPVGRRPLAPGGGRRRGVFVTLAMSLSEAHLQEVVDGVDESRWTREDVE